MAKPRMCPHCRAFIDPSDKVCEYCGNEVARPQPVKTGNETALKGLIPETHYTTFIILAVNFVLFIATLILSMKRAGGGDFSLFGGVDGHVLRIFGAKDAFFILRGGEWWRLVTAGFLHAGVFHILMNTWVLFDLGARVEEFYGTARYLVIYLFSSVAGFTLSMFWSPMSLSIGASAAACGLIGAMLAYGRRTGSSMIWSFYLRWAIFIAIIGLLPGFHIDNAAHLGGGAAGFALGWFAGSPRWGGAGETVWKAAAGLAMAATAVAFFFAYQSVVRGTMA